MVEVLEFGLVPYLEGLRLQEQFHKEVEQGKVDGVIMALRHPPTITLGRRAEWCEVLIPTEERRRRGIELYYVERGGGATYHGPRQAVIYPIAHLERLRVGVQELVQYLAFATIAVLGTEGVEARWDPTRPGVYVGQKKIASIGLQVTNGITMHGLALNVGPEAEGFSILVPCKEPGLRVTSVWEATGGKFVDPERMAQRLGNTLRDMLVHHYETGKIRWPWPGGGDGQHQPPRS